MQGRSRDLPPRQPGPDHPGVGANLMLYPRSVPRMRTTLVAVKNARMLSSSLLQIQTFRDVRFCSRQLLLVLRRQGLQVFDDIVLFPSTETETETRVVMVHNIEQGWESSIMEEPAFCVGPESV